MNIIKVKLALYNCRTERTKQYRQLRIMQLVRNWMHNAFYLSIASACMLCMHNIATYSWPVLLSDINTYMCCVMKLNTSRKLYNHVLKQEEQLLYTYHVYIGMYMYNCTHAWHITIVIVLYYIQLATCIMCSTDTVK